ncbi:MAG: VIT domain-containing protein, partial [Candidatus Parabeggiatoa sp.]|nr:VIT domain-containing protein [Candidatus Parabeggiatoa sp.]
MRKLRTVLLMALIMGLSWFPGAKADLNDGSLSSSQANRGKFLPSVSLTASDGSGLKLHQFKAQVVLDGFLAFTELKLVFYNPENRRREGRFQIVLPHNAAISRFAMKIGNRLQEGEVVEKQLARRAYEDFLHRRQDPALLEMDSGNRFNARIFPIEPKSEKVLILSYSQRLDDLAGEYVLPLLGLPQLKQFAIKVFYERDSFSSTTQLGELTGTVSKSEVLTIDKRDYQPTVDFRMPYQVETQNFAMQSGQLIAARIVPFTESKDNLETQVFDNLIVLVDTSASQAPYLADTLKRLETLLSPLKVGTLRLYTFDQTLKEIGIADTLATQTALLRQLQQYNALGASRLDAAMTTLKALELEQARLLLISDAVMTAGETNATALATQLKAINWLKRVDILVPSYHHDKNMARRLTKAGQLPGIVAPLTLSNVDLIRKLKSPVYADSPIKIEGSSWHWPEKVAGLQTNEPLIVFGELSPNQSKTIRIRVGDKTLSLASQAAEPILLKREWVRSRIDKLLAMEETMSDKDMKNAFHNEIIKLSVKERVLSPYTALLVLETENDYRRYNIDRRGLADILTIDDDGITVLKRTQIEPRRVEAPRPKLPMRQPEWASAPSPDENISSAQPPSREETRENQTSQPSVALSPRPSPTEAPLEMGTPPRIDPSAGPDESSENPPSPEEEVMSSTPPPSQDEEVMPRGEQQPFSDEDDERISSEQSRPIPQSACCADRKVNEMAPEPKDDDFLDKVPFLRDINDFLSKVMEAIADFFGKVMETIADFFDSNSSETNAEREARLLEEEARRAESEMAARQQAEARRAEREMAARQQAEARRRAESERAAARQQAEKARRRAEREARQPWTGHYAKFRALLDKEDLKAAGNLAQQWRQDDLANVMALIALGEWYQKSGDTLQAARAYGSLIDYFPARADIRRWAAERILALKSETGLSVDSLEKAVKQRPDHPSGHYLLAIA